MNEPSPIEYFKEAFRKYAVFQGRSRRKEYWFFLLFAVLIMVGLSFLDQILGTYDGEFGIGLLGSVFSLAIILPSITLTVRRLHDTGRVGWWVILAFIPIASLVLLVFMALDGEPGPNKYGPNPKGEGPVEQESA